MGLAARRGGRGERAVAHPRRADGAPGADPAAQRRARARHVAGHLLLRARRPADAHGPRHGPAVIPPPPLRRGDTVGIVAPSSPVAAHVPRRLARGVTELERHGFRVRLGAHVRNPHPTNADKLDELHELFRDGDVQAIVCTIGGYESHQLLEQLDFDVVAANPKVFSGYSDVTALLAAIHAVTGLVTFMGPALLTDWAEFGGIPAYTRAEWEATVTSAMARNAIPAAAAWTAEATRWDEADDRPRVWDANPGPRTVRAGVAEGPLAPANLSTLL